MVAISVQAVNHVAQPPFVPTPSRAKVLHSLHKFPKYYRAMLARIADPQPSLHNQQSFKDSYDLHPFFDLTYLTSLTSTLRAYYW
jgi:hypothetical protein